jgi:hypothetical protein
MRPKLRALNIRSNFTRSYRSTHEERRYSLTNSRRRTSFPCQLFMARKSILVYPPNSISSSKRAARSIELSMSSPLLTGLELGNFELRRPLICSRDESALKCCAMRIMSHVSSPKYVFRRRVRLKLHCSLYESYLTYPRHICSSYIFKFQRLFRSSR